MLDGKGCLLLLYNSYTPLKYCVVCVLCAYVHGCVVCVYVCVPVCVRACVHVCVTCVHAYCMCAIK